MALNRVGAGAAGGILTGLPEWTPRTDRGRTGGADGTGRDLVLPGRDGAADTPPGTDPELWSGLSPEERAFFARIGSLGPLTYGRTAETNGPPVFRGLHLDVTV
ncbi:hypothetical protein [Longimicrobium sp.]|uniref:hypothetical protein n=1 Tax=Longimicrobium sp. TaxID=2029185 RepID=UPI002E30F922|nr:hypothetical protein [Longimicrobium sp.]HEX6039391.1 hypothetical protein [Longimicrobium sp.]